VTLRPQAEPTTSNPPSSGVDVAVIGAGQAGLAVGYYLRRTGLSFVLLDAEEGPGGAWRHTWDSLTLFSPANASSLPGWLFPRGTGEYPTRDEVLAYLAEYEQRYDLPVDRPVRVTEVRPRKAGGVSTLELWGIRDPGPGSRAPGIADGGPLYTSHAVVSATGTWSSPVVPDVPGRDQFAGEQLHSARYTSPEPFAGKRVIVVGGGNSAAQLLAELSLVADTTWATREPPSFLADHIDGRLLFREESAIYNARLEGRAGPPPSLGDIVMVPAVREARERGVLTSVAMFTRMTRDGVVWPDGREERVDVVIWCTGFRAALAHLAPLGVVEPTGRARVAGTRALVDPRLWLVGYGNWTGYASATLIGVGRTARATVEEIRAALGTSTKGA
jgi:cation diffusion facilitator CzcD-associated flavoprotein CzcO